MADPFDTLCVPARFDLDAADLQRRLITLSTEHHPDRYTDPIEQADAADRIAQVNEAHRVLSDPARRADTLLRRLGAATDADEKALPPDLLMQMMEIREEMEAATEADDTATLDRLRAWAGEQRTAHLGAISDLFRTHPAPDDLGRRVRLELNSLRYIERMLEQMPPATEPGAP